jgi:uncharacterized protein (TIGR00369 family)
LTSEPAVRDVRIGGRRIEVTPHNCFACGTLNVHGLHLALHAGDDRCWVELALPDRFEGWEGIAHGGIVCTLLDEVMAWALIDHDQWGVTARMSVDFKRPVAIGRPIRAEGWVVSARRRLVEAEGVVLDALDGTELAHGTATYVGAPAARKDELKARYGFRLVDDDPATPGVVDGGVAGAGEFRR